MPWDPKDAPKHNHAATGPKGKKWAAVANNVLKNTGNDARAIRTANAAIRKPTPRGK